MEIDYSSLYRYPTRLTKKLLIQKADYRCNYRYDINKTSLKVFKFLVNKFWGHFKASNCFSIPYQIIMEELNISYPTIKRCLVDLSSDSKLSNPSIIKVKKMNYYLSTKDFVGNWVYKNKPALKNPTRKYKKINHNPRNQKAHFYFPDIYRRKKVKYTMSLLAPPTRLTFPFFRKINGGIFLEKTRTYEFKGESKMTIHKDFKKSRPKLSYYKSKEIIEYNTINNSYKDYLIVLYDHNPKDFLLSNPLLLRRLNDASLLSVERNRSASPSEEEKQSALSKPPISIRDFGEEDKIQERIMYEEGSSNPVELMISVSELFKLPVKDICLLLEQRNRMVQGDGQAISLNDAIWDLIGAFNQNFKEKYKYNLIRSKLQFQELWSDMKNLIYFFATEGDWNLGYEIVRPTLSEFPRGEAYSWVERPMNFIAKPELFHRHILQGRRIPSWAIRKSTVVQSSEGTDWRNSKMVREMNMNQERIMKKILNELNQDDGYDESRGFLNNEPDPEDQVH